MPRKMVKKKKLNVHMIIKGLMINVLIYASFFWEGGEGEEFHLNSFVIFLSVCENLELFAWQIIIQIKIYM